MTASKRHFSFFLWTLQLLHSVQYGRGTLRWIATNRFEIKKQIEEFTDNCSLALSSKLKIRLFHINRDFKQQRRLRQRQRQKTLNYTMCWQRKNNRAARAARNSLTIIERGWAKYRRLFVSGLGDQLFAEAERMRQIIDLRNNDKLRYFVIIEFNNCFIIRSLFFWSTKDAKSLSDSSANRPAIFKQERGFNYAWAEYYLQQNTYLQVTWCAFGQWKGRKKYIEC